LITQVRLEDQPECFIAAIDEVEVHPDRVADPLPVVVGLLDRFPNPADELVGVTLQKCQIQLKLAGKMLVEHWFADPGTLGDIVHHAGVVPVVDEDVGGCGEELSAPLTPGHSHPARCAVQPARCRFGHRPSSPPR
jgi:hypothetical protein